jgi:hypothetical protein
MDSLKKRLFKALRLTENGILREITGKRYKSNTRNTASEADAPSLVRRVLSLFNGARQNDNIKCPHCRRNFVQRVSRAGWAEVLFSVFYVYPFRCQLCGHRFRFFERGARYVRVKKDRREYERVEINFPVTFSGEKISGEGMSVNISMGGCSFTTTADLATGMIVKLALQTQTSLRPVIVDAAIVVARKSDSAGVEFLRWRGTERERLQLFIRWLLTDDILDRDCGF